MINAWPRHFFTAEISLAFSFMLSAFGFCYILAKWQRYPISHSQYSVFKLYYYSLYDRIKRKNSLYLTIWYFLRSSFVFVIAILSNFTVHSDCMFVRLNHCIWCMLFYNSGEDVCMHACGCHNVLSVPHLAAKLSKTLVSFCYFSLSDLFPHFPFSAWKTSALSSSLRNTMESLVMWS